MSMPPSNPDIRRQLKARLLALSPRAFELFAGDFLEYVGLKNVAVTRYIGDGGIDAQGELIAESHLVTIHTGIQVKRYRKNIRRPDIDHFIGALDGKFHHGIFITTASYAPTAREKALASRSVSVNTIDGDQITALMVQHELGIQRTESVSNLDEYYFLDFEALASSQPSVIKDEKAPYKVDAQDDLITLKALSYAIHVDMQTIRRNWIETGKLQPDKIEQIGSREAYFFRRDRIDAIRKQFSLDQVASSSDEWRQKFLDFAQSHRLTKSYKPVLLKAIFKLVDRGGEVQIDDLAKEFLAFYIERQRNNQPIEIGRSPIDNPATTSLVAVKNLIVKYPLDRFLLNGFLHYEADQGIVRFMPVLWQDLRFHDVIDLLRSADDQLAYYYNRMK